MDRPYPYKKSFYLIFFLIFENLITPLTMVIARTKIETITANGVHGARDC